MTVDTNSEYTAATTAASVGVNTPNFRPNTMMKGSTSAQVARRMASSTSAALLRGGGTTISLRTSHHQVATSDRASHTPGKMPAMNSLEIDTLAATPKITKPMLGGMMGAMMPADAISPAERARSWPAATIMGRSNAVSAAASATAEPDSDAMITAATIVT